MRLPFHAGHALGLGAFLILPIGTYAHRGIAPLFVGVALLCLLSWMNRRPVWGDVRGPLLLAVLALPAWAIASALWSITPAVSFQTGVSLAATLIGAVVIAATAATMTDGERGTVLTWIAWGGAVGFTWMVVDLHFDGPFYRVFADLKGNPVGASWQINLVMNPGGAVAAVFGWIWVAAVWMRGGGWLAAGAAALALAALSGIEADTPGVGLVLGGVAAAVTAGLRAVSITTAVRIVCGALGVYVLSFPVLIVGLPSIFDIARAIPRFSDASAYMMASLYHRITIWQTTVMHTQESPILGLGFDTARALYGAGIRGALRLRSTTKGAC
jgi:hypothetical protein